MTNKIKVGDLVTAYWSGYYIVEDIDTKEYPKCPQAIVRQVADSTGKSRKGKKTRQCALSYCNLVTLYDIIKEYQESIKEAKNKSTRLRLLYQAVYSGIPQS